MSKYINLLLEEWGGDRTCAVPAEPDIFKMKMKQSFRMRQEVLYVSSSCRKATLLCKALGVGHTLGY